MNTINWWNGRRKKRSNKNKKTKNKNQKPQHIKPIWCQFFLCIFFLVSSNLQISLSFLRLESFLLLEDNHLNRNILQVLIKRLPSVIYSFFKAIDFKLIYPHYVDRRRKPLFSTKTKKGFRPHLLIISNESDEC